MGDAGICRVAGGGEMASCAGKDEEYSCMEYQELLGACDGQEGLS